MRMGGTMSIARMGAVGEGVASVEYFVNVAANITYTCTRGNNQVGKNISALVDWACAAPEKDIVKTTITALVDWSVDPQKAITITAPFVAGIDYTVSVTKNAGKAISAAVQYAVARPTLAIGKNVSAGVAYSVSVLKAVSKNISASVSQAAGVIKAITKDTIAIGVDYSVSALKAVATTITINVPIGVTYLQKAIGKNFSTSMSWAIGAVRLATRFITDLNILQLPVNAVLAHKYLFKKSGDTVEKRDPNYKFERMASRRTGVRRLNRGDGPSFTTKTDKKGYD